MRWPLMFRATHDALMAAKDRELAVWKSRGDTMEATGREAVRLLVAERDSIMADHRAFVATIAEKSLPRPLPVVAPVPKRERDAADNAIDFASAFDPRRRRHLEQYVRARRAEGMAADDIAQEVLHPAEDGDGAWEMPE